MECCRGGWSLSVIFLLLVACCSCALSFNPSQPLHLSRLTDAFDSAYGNNNFKRVHLRARTSQKATDFFLSIRDDEAAPPITSVTELSIGGNKSTTGPIIGGVIGGVVFVLLSSMLVWLFVFRKRGSEAPPADEEQYSPQASNQNRNDDSNDTRVQRVAEVAKKCGPRDFSYAEIARMTDNLSDKCRIGSGGFGIVYKATIKQSNLNVDVAVKRITGGFDQGLQEYVAEMEIISQTRHRNLVQLIGWCHENKKLFLVYELLPNGSLDHHLFGNSTLLSWELRYKIAKDLALALLYLHDSCNMCILHRDIKSNNVLLDSKFNAKLGDFGLAKLVDHEKGWHETRYIAGTKGYMAPEYFNSGIASKESDIYSFGIVILEIATGKRVSFMDETGAFVDLLEWVWNLYGTEGKHLHAADPKLCSVFDVGEMERLLVLGLWCAYPVDTHRPSISKVISVLNFEMELPKLPPKMPNLQRSIPGSPITKTATSFPSSMSKGSTTANSNNFLSPSSVYSSDSTAS